MDLERFKDWVYKEFRINLHAYKENQLHRRLLSLMSRVGAKSVDEYIDILKKDKEQRQKFLDFITINVTEFFRNPEMFEDLKGKIKTELLPENKNLKIWSAACSIGAEPYSLGILLDELAPSGRHTILATDLDEKILERAKQGFYTENDIKNVKKDRLDKFMNMVSELVIHRTRLEQISQNYKSIELNETLEQVARTTSDLQDLVMKIRMLPLDIVFNRFPRLIRDLSVELNKEMELIIKGQDTELDRTVIDEIGEPLIHLIRNAADHGIEPTEERIKKGKDPVGKIKLLAYQEGTKAVIKVEDDGGGIDVEKIKAKAERLNISTEGMTDNDIRNLIFMQGFSTNEQVTDISGRGVGMDVVKTKIASLGGSVEVISEHDKGSSFIIRLPLTLQIIQALLVKVGEETMAISLGYIDRVIDFKEDLVKKTNNKEVIIYNENVIPLIRLNKRLNLEESNSQKKYIVIVKIGEKNVGLLVDSLLGQQEIVIKPLGKTLQGLKEYIGATILGDGLVTLILDVGSLV